MKATTYARLSLFLPYLFLLGALVYLRLPDPGSAPGMTLDNLSFVWAYSALFWLVPYSISVVCLLLWSKGKSLETIAIVYSFAPCVLAVVTLITYTIVQVAIWIYTGQLWEGLEIFAFSITFTVVASLVVGYVFVGIVLLLFVLLKRIGLIKDGEARESPVGPSASPPPANSL